jgi:hypothetical protein
MKKNLSLRFARTRTLALSGIVMALFVSVMFVTQSFASGFFQSRIATALYALPYYFPFLVLPLGLANGLSNLLFGGLGLPDIVGGFLVGLATGGGVYAVRRFGLPLLTVIPVIILLPGLIVPIWLAPILTSFAPHEPVAYWPLAISVCSGQTIPALLGYILLKELPRLNLKELLDHEKA